MQGHIVEIKKGFKPKKDWAVFLDRDGVVIEETPERLRNFNQFKIIPPAASAVKKLNDRKIPVFLTTNQTTVARGECTEDFIVQTHQKIKRELARQGAFFNGVFTCLHSPYADIRKYRVACNWRKPNFGMFEFIAKKFNFDLKKSFLVGDKARDILAAKSLGMKDILVLSGHAGEDTLYKASPTVIKKDILEAAEYIIKQNE